MNDEKIFTAAQVLAAYYAGFNEAHYSELHPEFPQKEITEAAKEYMLKMHKVNIEEWS